MATAKRKQTVLTLTEKLNICERLARGAPVTLLSKYQVGKSTISNIKRNEVKLKQFAFKLDGCNSSTKRCTMKSAKDTTLDDAVFMVYPYVCVSILTLFDYMNNLILWQRQSPPLVHKIEVPLYVRI